MWHFASNLTLLPGNTTPWDSTWCSHPCNVHARTCHTIVNIWFDQKLLEVSVSLTVTGSNRRQSHPLATHAHLYHVRGLLTLLLSCSMFLSNHLNHPRVRAGHSTHSILRSTHSRVWSSPLRSSTHTYCLLPFEQESLCFRHVSICVLIMLASFFQTVLSFAWNAMGLRMLSHRCDWLHWPRLLGSTSCIAILSTASTTIDISTTSSAPSIPSAITMIAASLALLWIASMHPTLSLVTNVCRSSRSTRPLSTFSVPRSESLRSLIHGKPSSLAASAGSTGGLRNLQTGPSLVRAALTHERHNSHIQPLCWVLVSDNAAATSLSPHPVANMPTLFTLQ